MSSQTILRCCQVSKRYGRATVLQDVDLAIQQGEIVGLLGANGAGKTTLIKCIMQLIRPTGGTILFRERPLVSGDIQQHVGFLPENFQPPGTLNAHELLGLLAKGLGLRPARVETCLKQVGLSEQIKKPIRAYSRGMIQRLGLAIALLKEPAMMLLDEPTLGLDPLGQAQMLQMLLDLNAQGATIFFSSHILSQIERVCHRIAVIQAGQLRFVGPVKEFIQKHQRTTLEDAFLQEMAGVPSER